MQITDLNTEQTILPILRLGFRPFFLLGSLFSAVALILWGLSLNGVIALDYYGGANWWHTHEMVFGFTCAIIVGFLLTAVQNWTGQRGLHGKPLLLLVTIWLLGRLSLLFPNILGNLATAIIDISFMPLAALFLALPLIKVKQSRNLFFIPLLLLFSIANIEMHLVANGLFNLQLQPTTYASVLLVTFIISVMAGRVTPMFTANGTQTEKVASIEFLEKIANGSLLIILLTYLLHPFFSVTNTVYSILFTIAAISQMVRWLRWKPWITLSVPLLWSLHIAVMFIWLGLFALALSFVIPTLPSNHIWHILTVGGMGGLILAMISRVSLGHTGSPLVVPGLMPFAFMMISFAALIRTLGPWLSPENYIIFINFSILTWVLAYGLFIFYYAPKLLKARKDGRPG